MDVQYDAYSVSVPYRRRSWPARLTRWALLLLSLALYGAPILYCVEHAHAIAEPPGSPAWYQLPASPWPHS